MAKKIVLPVAYRAKGAKAAVAPGTPVEVTDEEHKRLSRIYGKRVREASGSAPAKAENKS